MGGARILVIEDNADNLELVCYLLRAFGHCPVPAVNGRTGVDAARAQRPDLVLCDLQLPDIDGLTVACELRAEAHLVGLPLVAVTAFARPTDRERVLAGGFDGYLSKPIDPELFVSQIEAFLPAALRHTSVSPCIPPTRPGIFP